MKANFENDKFFYVIYRDLMTVNLFDCINLYGLLPEPVVKKGKIDIFYNFFLKFFINIVIK